MISFDTKFEQNCKESTGSDFECSLNHVLQSNATIKFPKFSKGTLPKQFESAEAANVAEAKKAIGGDAQWLDQFAKNRKLHFQMHGGKGVEPMVDNESKKSSSSAGKAAVAKSSKAKSGAAENEVTDDEVVVSVKKPLRTKGTLCEWHLARTLGVRVSYD